MRVLVRFRAYVKIDGMAHLPYISDVDGIVMG